MQATEMVMVDPGFCAVEPGHELADRVGMAMARLNKMHAQVAHQMAKQGFDKASFILLATLASTGPCRSSTLAEAVLSDPSTVSRQVATLVKDGLVERRADPADGRASVLAATHAGLKLLQERRRLRNVWLTKLFQDWDDADWKQFADLFDRFVQDYEVAIPSLMSDGGLGARAEGENR